MLFTWVFSTAALFPFGFVCSVVRLLSWPSKEQQEFKTLLTLSCDSVVAVVLAFVTVHLRTFLQSVRMECIFHIHVYVRLKLKIGQR